MTNKDWKEEFREYFDKTLKPKKPTMKNLDRELMIDFIEKLLSSQRKEWAEKILGIKKNMKFAEMEGSESIKNCIIYNRAIDSVASLLGKEEDHGSI